MSKSAPRMHRRFALAACFALGMSVGFSAPAAAQESDTMKIRFDYNGTPVIAVIEDNPASRDFLDMLPLTVTLDDYAATEKVANLPGSLSTAGAPSGMEPKAGDVTYYAPWGNLAIFIKGFRHSAGLVKLGHIEQGLDALRQPGTAEVTIEVVRD